MNKADTILGLSPLCDQLVHLIKNMKGDKLLMNLITWKQNEKTCLKMLCKVLSQTTPTALTGAMQHFHTALETEDNLFCSSSLKKT